MKICAKVTIFRTIPHGPSPGESSSSQVVFPNPVSFDQFRGSVNCFSSPGEEAKIANSPGEGWVDGGHYSKSDMIHPVRSHPVSPLAPDFHTLQIELLHLLSGPVSFTQKSKTRFDGRIIGKTVDPDQISQLRPTVKIDKLVQYQLQSLAVKGVVLLGGVHYCSIFLFLLCIQCQFNCAISCYSFNEN